MLRFLYLLSLLLCIELSFCYNYIDEATEHNLNKLGKKLRRERHKRARKPKELRSLIRQEYDYDRSPVEFDVASFTQPDEESLEEDEASIRNWNKKRRRTSKDYDYDSLMAMDVDENNKKREKSPDYMSMGDSPADLNLNPPLFKDAINTKHLNYNSLDDLHEKYGHERFRNIYKDDLLMDQNAVHSQEKKCALKNFKFPFFSHNKSEPLKPKKNKKRKLFCFNSHKKEIKPTDEIKMTDDTMIHYKMKRSFEERLCPACKKIFLANMAQSERRKKTPKRVIHNSRQFFQNNLSNPKLKEDVKNIRKNKATGALDVKYRNKREDIDRERQLKELEEVQRKIDNVEIHLPRFEKPAEKNVFK